MIFYYTDVNGNEAFCEIARKGNLVIATELAANTGASVTNSCEIIATEICKQKEIAFEDLIFVEHYDKNSYRNKQGEESFSRVCFSQGAISGESRLTAPTWQPLTVGEYMELLESQSHVAWE